MFTFLLVLQAIVTLVLIGVILMQRSEGGGLGMGGSPSGLMSARGAADFLTRSTTILATVFVTLSIALAVIAAGRNAPGTIDTSLAREAPVPAQQPTVPLANDPLAAAAAGSATNTAAPAPSPVPLATTPAPAPAPRTETPRPRAARPEPAETSPARSSTPAASPPVAVTQPAPPVTTPPANSN